MLLMIIIIHTFLTCRNVMTHDFNGNGNTLLSDIVQIRKLFT